MGRRLDLVRPGIEIVPHTEKNSSTIVPRQFRLQTHRKSLWVAGYARANDLGHRHVAQLGLTASGVRFYHQTRGLKAKVLKYQRYNLLFTRTSPAGAWGRLGVRAVIVA